MAFDGRDGSLFTLYYWFAQRVLSGLELLNMIISESTARDRLFDTAEHLRDVIDRFLIAVRKWESEHLRAIDDNGTRTLSGLLSYCLNMYDSINRLKNSTRKNYDFHLCCDDAYVHSMSDGTESDWRQGWDVPGSSVVAIERHYGASNCCPMDD
jgi:hypothetical protein